MTRVFKDLFFITGLVYFAAGQYSIWANQTEKIVPSLLSAIGLFLIAIYLKEGNQ